MKQRFDFTAVAPDGYKAMLGVQLCPEKRDRSGAAGTGEGSGIAINGWAFCLAMHIPLGRQHGVSETS